MKSTLPFCVDGAIRANYCLGFSDNLPYEKIGKNKSIRIHWMQTCLIAHPLLKSQLLSAFG